MNRTINPNRVVSYTQTRAVEIRIVLERLKRASVGRDLLRCHQPEHYLNIGVSIIINWHGPSVSFTSDCSHVA